MSIIPFQHCPYLPGLTSSLSLHHELAFLPLRSLASHNPRSLSLYLPCIKSAFSVISPPQSSFWIVSCAMLPMLAPCLAPNHYCLYSPHDVRVWNASSICHIRQLEVAKGSFSEHWPLYLLLTLLLGEMLDVAKKEPYGGKLCLLCHGW